MYMSDLETLKKIQLKILNSILKILLLIAAIVFLVISMEEIPQKMYSRVLLIYLPGIVLLSLVTFLNKIPIKIRVNVLIFLIMAVGITDMLYWGFSSMAFYFFISAAILASIIDSPSLGWTAFGFSIFTILTFMILYSFNVIPEYSRSQLVARNLSNWFAPLTAYIMLQVTILVVIQTIINHLKHSLSENIQKREQLQIEKSSLKKANDELEMVAYIDSVTGLPNNKKIIQDIGQLIAINEGSTYKIHQLLIEIIDFEEINIKYGLHTGNKVLKIIANRLNELPGCKIYRMTGSQFLIHCEHEQSNNNYDKIIRIFNEPVSSARNVLEVHYRGASIRYPEDINNPTLLIPNLMLTLNNAHSSNRDFIVEYSEVDTEKILRKNNMKDLLITALKKNEISVYIQPRMDARTGDISGGELLLRWFNDLFGTISPDEFIPISENDNMIFPLTHHLMNVSLEIENYINRVDRSGKDFSLSVNISPVIIQANRLHEFIEYTKQSSQFIRYEFELTEGVFLGLTETIWNEINELHKNNIVVSIDDFGTGYSNLDYLQKLNINILKIDKKFIDGIPHDEKQKHLVMAIIQMAKALNLKTVAEGVEYKEQLLWLQENGIDEIQGYLLAKPMDLSYFKAFYQKHDSLKWKKIDN